MGIRERWADVPSDPLEQTSWERGKANYLVAAQSHPGLNFLWTVVPAVLAVVFIPSDLVWRLIVAFVAAAAGWLAVPLGWATVSAAFAPPKQRDEARERVWGLETELRLQELRHDLSGFRQTVEPFVQRLRYIAGEGGPPPSNVHVVDAQDAARWRGFDVERQDVDERVLEPTRKRLKAYRRDDLAGQVSVEAKELGPSELAAELDRILGAIETWSQNDPSQMSPEAFAQLLDSLIREGMSLHEELAQPMKPIEGNEHQYRLGPDDEAVDRLMEFDRHARDLLTTYRPSLLPVYAEGANDCLRRNRDREKSSDAVSLHEFVERMHRRPAVHLEAFLEGLSEARNRLGL